jgi:RND family efflux transporter MFP subunit
MTNRIILPLILIASAACGLSADDTPVLTYLRPIREINLASGETGVIDKVLVKPGDHVTKSQEILRLNSAVIEAQLAQAEAQALHEGRLKAAEAERQIARQRLDLINDLLNRGSTNQAEYDKATASLAVADGQLKAAQEDRDALRYQSATIKAQLDQRILRSPINGIVTEVTREIGEAVESRRTDVPSYLAKIVDLSQLIARVHIPSQLAGGLHLDQHLPITLDNPAKSKGEGSIIFISPTVDAATNLTEVHLIFKNAGGELQSGISGTLRVPFSP